jgi:hypothetical protein
VPFIVPLAIYMACGILSALTTVSGFRRLGAGQEFVGLRVLQDDFLLGVPFQFAANALAIIIVTDQQRDEAEVAGNGRVVARFRLIGNCFSRAALYLTLRG